MVAGAIDADTLVEQACETVGLDDFGAPSYRAGLDHLVDSLNGEAELNDLGRASATRMVSTILVDRLRIEEWVRTHPDLRNERIERPIVIVGMSRSGTTALSQLLGQDPALRSLMRWEAMAAVPPAEPGTWRHDPRYLATVEADAMSDAVMPGLKALHHDPPDGPVECNQLFAHEFQGSVFWTAFCVPSFFRWTSDADLTDAYDYHHRVLQLLQSRMGGTWNLKGPQHGVTMETLRRRYPDAVLVATHRDPAVCCASTASLIAYLHGVSSERAQPQAIGRMAYDFITRCADGLVADAARHPGGDATLHVAYGQLVRDPLAIVRTLYDQMGRELSLEAERAMTEHVEQRPHGKYGVHRYRATDFGLEPGILEERFREYREVFDVDYGAPRDRGMDRDDQRLGEAR